MKHAIVIGGSMTGLLATRVLSDHFEYVTLVERDVLPTEAENRRGVPQGRHTHGLLAGGREALEHLFPGLTEQAVSEGAIFGDIVERGRWVHEGAPMTQFESGLKALALSRPFLENLVRQRVLRILNVTLRQGCQVEGLEWSADGRRVTGVKCSEETLMADLVIDATGRGSRSMQWLASAGYEKPEEERVEIALGYTTRYFRRSPADANGDVAIIIPPTPQGKRGGVMVAQEGDRWTVTLIAHFGNYAPEELDGFIEFARTLPGPYIYEVISKAEPISSPASARYPASVRRRYERLKRFPEGYLVMGDSLCSFNPIYGQGMTVAALEAVELQRTLKSRGMPSARVFFQRLAKIVDIPWSIAAGNDLRMPETKGRRTAAVNFINWYMSKLHKAAHHDRVPTRAFHQVANLLSPPSAVFHPYVALRVLLGNLALSENPTGGPF
jgi:2-polyprenyl-6-methoxyphenol hydroxylase-like FAD-dependent oxidoreductase